MWAPQLGRALPTAAPAPLRALQSGTRSAFKLAARRHARKAPTTAPAAAVPAARRMASRSPAAASSSSTPRRDLAAAERLPLFGSSAEGSPMGTLKHRAGGSLGDVAVASGLADERGGIGGPPPPPAGLAGLAPAVLLCVAVASMGAFSFGYHLGVVNGPLEEMAVQLGFGGDTFRQGLVRLSWDACCLNLLFYGTLALRVGRNC